MKKRKRPKTATTRRVAFCASISLLFSLCLAIPLTSQTSHGRERKKAGDYALIFGTVWGPDDRPVAGINVNIRRSGDTKPRWVVRSNARGEFLQRVPVGRADYVVWADIRSYKLPAGKHLRESPQVTVHLDNNERADTGLHLK